MTPTARTAARILLVDSQERVLLFHGCDPARPGVSYWFTPGGGLGDGEAAQAGAARELAEETGLWLTEAQIGAPVHTDLAEFSFDGVTYRQEQMFFLVRVAQWTVDSGGFEDYERRSIDQHRWWSIAELDRTEETYYPADLIGLLKKVGLATC
jgi:ADP-ribose pyrophosphatase YjhB (NUDIX family)